MSDVLENGYVFTRDDLPRLLALPYYPEHARAESAVVKEFLTAHGTDYDQFAFSVRVGQGAIPDPTHSPGIQKATLWSFRKRIDLIAFQGRLATIIEVKLRVTPTVLGQSVAYRHLWLEDHPDAREPRLVVLGTYSDTDTLRVLSAQGVDVYIYALPQAP